MTYYRTPNEQTHYFNAFSLRHGQCQRAGLDNRAAVAAAELAGEQAVDALRAQERLAAEERQREAAAS